MSERLKKYRNAEGIVLAVPRGGVPVAYAVAKELNLPLQLILTKKIGHPVNKEYAIGAASLTDHFFIPHEGVSEEYIRSELEKIRKRLREMYDRFQQKGDATDIKGKTVIVVDDGVATGNTLLGTIRIIRKQDPAKIVVAVPVAAESAFEKLSEHADEVVAVLLPELFYGVGAFYEDFEQLEDDDVLFYLDKLRELRKAG